MRASTINIPGFCTALTKPSNGGLSLPRGMLCSAPFNIARRTVGTG